MPEDIMTQVNRIMAIPGLMREEDVRLLYRVAGLARPGGCIVELGTYCGRSVAALWLGSRSRIGIEPMVYSIDDYSYASAEHISLLKARAQLDALECRVHLFQGDTRIVPVGIQHVSLLHVDSTHTKAHFDAEMNAWMSLLIPGAIVACHDFNSPKWTEMNEAILGRLGSWQRLGLATRMIAFQKPLEAKS